MANTLADPDDQERNEMTGDELKRIGSFVDELEQLCAEHCVVLRAHDSVLAVEFPPDSTGSPTGIRVEWDQFSNGLSFLVEKPKNVD